MTPRADSANSVSIVLATHNGERYLQEQLESLRQQTMLPIELIVSDDDSKDETAAIVEKFIATAPFPVIYKSNSPALGFADNFMSAVSLASGNWIAFCDQDDIWASEKLSKCNAFMSLPEVTQIVHQAALIDGDGAPIGFFRQGIETTGLRKPLHYDAWGTFAGFSQIIRRSVFSVSPAAERFEDYIRPGNRVAHDRWGHFLSQSLGYTAEIAEPLVSYRQHGKNVYGAVSRIKKVRSLVKIREENSVYCRSTKAMAEVISTIPPQSSSEFPAFDAARTTDFFAKAYQQVLMRDRLYASRWFLRPFIAFSGLVSGRYRNAHDRMQRWRSIGKDFGMTFRR